MTTEIEILELGDDGTFDISSTVEIQQQKSEAIDYATYDWSKAEKTENLNLVKSLKENEYAVYESPDRKSLWIITKLEQGSRLKELQLSDDEKQLQFVADNNKKLMIDLSRPILKNSITCKVFNEAITLTVTLRVEQ